MTDDHAIRVHQLHKTYRDGIFGKRSIDALNGVSFEVPRGQVFGLLGPNGAGKTTLIKVLLGIVRRTQGDAYMLGYVAGDRRSRKRVGYLPEGHRIPAHHTGNTALEFLGRLSGMSYRDIRRRRSELMDRVGLSKWGKTSIKKYSKGMQQRLGLAQAMLHDPELLILDEPTDGVDPVGRSEMRELLHNLRDAGTTIFINSHLLQEVELICDKVAILHGGRLRREAAVGDLTELSGGRIRMRVVGDGDTIQQLTGSLTSNGASANVKATVSDQLWDIELECRDQSTADRYLDQVRAAGVSVQSFMPVRRTLEEAFLDIIQSDAAPENAARENAAPETAVSDNATRNRTAQGPE